MKSRNHNAPSDDELQIGDMPGMHDVAYERVSAFDYGNAEMPDMDPADSLMPDGNEPQPNGVGMRAESPRPVYGAGID